MIHGHRSQKRGYTLIELVVSMAASSMLMAGMFGAIFIANRAFEGSDVQHQKNDTADALAAIMADVRHATSFSERTATAVTFDVPDRDGDSLPETIRYAWSGAPGDPLTYEYNGSPMNLAEDVQHVTFSALTRFMAAPVIPPAAGGNKLLLVVTDTAGMTAQETARQSLIESWGYTVTLIDDGDTQANFDAAVAENHVAYISDDVSETAVGNKLSNASIGLVNEKKELVDEFAFSSSTSGFTNDRIEITDNSHYITEPFSIGELTVLTTTSEMQTLAGTLAGGLELLTAELGTTDHALTAIENGGDLYGGGTANNRRAYLPWGGVDLNLVNTDGRTLMQRSIEWAAGAGGSGGPLLLVVSDAASPSTNEIARKTLMESWGYTVSLLDDDATTLELATAMSLNDVIYVSQEVTTLSVLGKLKDATIGVVNEEYLLSSDLGFGSGTGTGFYNDISLVDNTHYITSEFSSGPLALFDPTYDIYTGTGFTLAPDADVLGETGSITGLMALDKGAALWNTGNAVGRRVLVPWGNDFAALNANGQTLMRRAIEWASEAEPQSIHLLFVVADPGNLVAKESGRKSFFESWGYAVTLIDDADSQANFDAATAVNDVVYVSSTIVGGSLANKLTGSTTAIVNEFPGKLDNLGFSSGTTTTVSGSGFSNSNAAHDISSPFSGNAITAFTSSLSMPVPGGTLAPGMQNVAEASSTPALVTLDTGAERYDGGPAPARRVHLPFANGETNQLTADGQTLMQRAIAWAASADEPPTGGVVFEEFTEGRNQVGVSAGVSIPKPSGAAAGDLLILAVATDGNTVSTLSPPGSWNLTQLDVGQSGSDAVTLGVWWKIADGTEGSAVNVQWTGGEQAYGWFMRFTGHHPTSPIATASMNTGNNKTPLSNNLITGTDGNLVLRLGAFDDDDITEDDPGLSGHTAITMDRSNTGVQNTVSGGAGYIIQPTAGDTGTSNFSLSAREQYRTVTIAIKPDPSP